MLDFLDDRGGSELVERDDGNIEPSGGPDVYFSGPVEWAPYELDALKHVRGRVLDIGRGVGRISVTPWFDDLPASEAEVEDLLEGTGWSLQHSFHSGAGPYSMVIGNR